MVNLLIPCFSSESYRCTCLLQWERGTQLFMMQIFQHVTWVILPHTVLGEDYILNWIRLYSTHETLAVTVPCSKNQCLKAGNSICLQVVSMFQQCAFSCSFFFFFFIFIIFFFFLKLVFHVIILWGVKLKVLLFFPVDLIYNSQLISKRLFDFPIVCCLRNQISDLKNNVIIDSVRFY